MDGSLTDLLGAIDFDPDALRARYRLERDRRIRPGASAQYREPVGNLAHYAEDPYAGPAVAREPLTDHVTATVIGGGFAGLTVAATLRAAGVDDVRLIDSASDVGGTWYWNRYPGAACDVESYIYLPLLEELGDVPSHKYVFAPEIFEHARRIARHFDLYRNALLRTRVSRLQWVEAHRAWTVETDRGDAFTSRFVVMANGPLNRPKFPGIPGIDSFRGRMFHTSRWDYGYTGGDSSGGLTSLHDKRVGIIGTGATAIQCVPHLADSAQHLYVFQRTPSSVDARNNSRTDVEWFKSQPAGWQRERMANFTTLINGGSADRDLVHDGWTDMTWKLSEITRLAAGHAMDAAERSRMYELVDFKKMENLRDRMSSIVDDPSTAQALKPYYRFFCKRPCFNDDYLATFNRPNVTLVDTAGQGVRQLTELAAVVDDVEYELDCLVFATGFDVSSDYTKRAGYEVYGRDGTALSEKWRSGVRSFHGIQTAGFPNLFFVGTAQTGITFNFAHSITEAAQHIGYLVEEVRSREGTRVEASESAERAWCAEVERTARIGSKFYAECTPGYYNSEGQAGNPVGLFANTYGLGATSYFTILHEWRNDGRLDGITID